jgi:hypothetical protein
MEKYFVIRNSCGDTHIDVYTKEKLIKMLNELSSLHYIDDFDFDSDTNYWGDSIMIIKGKLVSPSPVQVVTTYEVE